MRTLTAVVIVGCLAASARGEMVTERWGAGDRCRHAGTVAFTDAGGGAVMTFDLSKLPRGAKVHRARLLMPLSAGPGPLARPVRIRPMLSAYSTGGGWAVGDPLPLVPPRFRSFDATDVVRRWASGKGANHGLQVTGAPGWKRSSTYLEITYEGNLTAPPPPATDLEAFHRAGQVFLTWKEARCPFAGMDDVPWDRMKAHKKRLAAGKVPRVAYRIYRHVKPITAESIAEAKLLDEAPQLSAFDERMIKTEWKGERIKNVRVGSAPVPRVCVRPLKLLPVGTGVYVRTSDKAGAFHYAVVAAVDGVENTRDLNAGNTTARPLIETVARPEPVLHHEKDSHVYDRGRPHRFYLLWADPPLSHLPNVYHLGITSPAKPAQSVPLYVQSWWWDNGWAGSGAREGVKGCVSVQMETPWILHKGIHEGTGTYKAWDQGTVQDYWVRRLRNVLPWLRKHYHADPDRTYAMSSDWAWHHGDLFAVVHENLTTDPKRSPVAIKGDRFWGDPKTPAKTEWSVSAWDHYDIAGWVRRHPTAELPLVYYTPNMHLGDFGKIDKPRFYRAMLDTKRAFMASWGARLRPEWIYQLKRTDPLAAFANCSLDDDPGIGMGDGDPAGQINGYLRFDPSDAVDELDRWEMNVWLQGPDSRGQGGPPRDSCTVDVTPRRCRRFKPKPGEKFAWTAAPLPAKDGSGAPAAAPAGQKGSAVADKHGLVTAEKVVVGRRGCRIKITRR